MNFLKLHPKIVLVCFRILDNVFKPFRQYQCRSCRIKDSYHFIYDTWKPGYTLPCTY